MMPHNTVSEPLRSSVGETGRRVDTGTKSTYGAAGPLCKEQIQRSFYSGKT